jgi:hypothetical protein
MAQSERRDTGSLEEFWKNLYAPYSAFYLVKMLANILLIIIDVI